MAEANVMTAETVGKSTQQRNYQLDFLKLIFTFFVFLSHTSVFISENTKITLPYTSGTISVNFFFIVSGMLMTNSIVKNNVDILTPGKSAISFVLKKFKAISLQYWTALFIYLLIYI